MSSIPIDELCIALQEQRATCADLKHLVLLSHEEGICLFPWILRSRGPNMAELSRHTPRIIREDTSRHDCEDDDGRLVQREMDGLVKKLVSRFVPLPVPIIHICRRSTLGHMIWRPPFSLAYNEPVGS